MSPLNRHIVQVVRREASARGWSPVRLRSAAHIRRNAMKGRKPLNIEEIARAGKVIGMGSWPMLYAVMEDLPPARRRGDRRVKP